MAGSGPTARPPTPHGSRERLRSRKVWLEGAARRERRVVRVAGVVRRGGVVNGSASPGMVVRGVGARVCQIGRESGWIGRSHLVQPGERTGRAKAPVEQQPEGHEERSEEDLPPEEEEREGG